MPSSASARHRSASRQAQNTDPKESATRKRIDLILNNLKWKTDESSPSCNVFTERPKTVAQKRALKANEPDYVLYRSGTNTPIAVIEAKRSGESLRKARDKAVRVYAQPLKVNVVFVANGAIVETFDRRSGQALLSDGEPVTTFLSEKHLLRFIDEGPDIQTPAVVQHTKQELIEVFRDANDLLRREGLREGIERFTEFSNLLFLKLISEIEEERDGNTGERRILEKKYCWDAFCQRSAEDMLDYINDTILPRLVDRYNHSGDVFQSKLLITSPITLKRIVEKLSALTLLDTDSDIKGDAFEYFLKNSISVGNDLGEYFTPRHLVRLMVDLIDPRVGERIYDPACGTGGFLIQAFRHIKRRVKQTKANLRRLKEKTVYGRELTGTAKIAKMNMIIIGDGHTNVEQKDSLKFPVKSAYDVVLTNYPFSQETEYANYYGLTTESANPVFLKHVIDALKDAKRGQEGGRAAVVVPEGLLFDETSQCEKVRRVLVESCDLKAVVSLHEYAFRPYTGQPTSILVFQKGRATSKVWFFDVREDGFAKTHRLTGRAPIPENDLPLLRQSWDEKADSDRSFSVQADAIRAHGYKLTADEYRDTYARAGWVPLGGKDGLCELVIGGTPLKRNLRFFGGPHLWVKIGDMSNANGLPITATEETITDAGRDNSNVKLVPKGTLLLSFKLSVGKVAIAGADLYTNEAIAALIPKDGRVLPKYLYYVLPELTLFGTRKAAKGRTSSKGRLAKVRVPVPSIPVQRKLISAMDRKEAEIRTYERKIETAVMRERELVTEFALSNP